MTIASGTLLTYRIWCRIHCILLLIVEVLQGLENLQWTILENVLFNSYQDSYFTHRSCILCFQKFRFFPTNELQTMYLRAQSYFRLRLYKERKQRIILKSRDNLPAIHRKEVCSMCRSYLFFDVIIMVSFIVLCEFRLVYPTTSLQLRINCAASQEKRNGYCMKFSICISLLHTLRFTSSFTFNWRYCSVQSTRS